MRRECKGTATLQQLFLYTLSYSRIRLNDCVAGVSYAPYAGRGHCQIFSKLACLCVKYFHAVHVIASNEVNLSVVWLV